MYTMTLVHLNSFISPFLFRLVSSGLSTFQAEIKGCQASFGSLHLRCFPSSIGVAATWAGTAPRSWIGTRSRTFGNTWIVGKLIMCTGETRCRCFFWSLFVHGFVWMAISSLKVEKMGVVWRGNSSKTSSPARMRGRWWQHTPTPHVPWRPTVPSVFFFENNKSTNIRNYQHYQLFWRSLRFPSVYARVVSF